MKDLFPIFSECDFSMLTWLYISCFQGTYSGMYSHLEAFSFNLLC